MTNTTKKNIARELDPVQADRMTRAPLPTSRTIRGRRNLPFQFIKFALFNLRIINITIRERLGE